jgi:hypothetical protein
VFEQFKLFTCLRRISICLVEDFVDEKDEWVQVKVDI